MKRVCVAGPYTRGDIIPNIRAALFQADWLLAAGYAPFVPHLTGFWGFASPKKYETWMEYDMEWLRACDALLRMAGESPGADREVALAESLGIPVFYSVPELITGLPK